MPQSFPACWKPGAVVGPLSPRRWALRRPPTGTSSLEVKEGANADDRHSPPSNGASSLQHGTNLQFIVQIRFNHGVHMSCNWQMPDSHDSSARVAQRARSARHPRQQPWGGVPPGGSMGVGTLTRRSVLALPPLWSSRSGPYSGQRVPWAGVRLARRRSAPLGPASGAVGRPSRRR